MRINAINHFRAVSIVFIVAGHSFYTVGMEIDSLLDITIKNLVDGGTSLFVFISGFLFHHIYSKGFQYKHFMVKKFSYVLLPYLILGFIPVFFKVVIKNDNLDGYFLPSNAGVIYEYLVPALKYYVTGGFLIAYWYIPFIIATFALSPIHIKYIELGLKSQILIVLLGSLVSILIHRPIGNILVIQSVIYFTPLYLVGILTSIHKENIYRHLEGKEIYLLLVVIILAVFQAYIGQSGNYHKTAFEFSGIDLMFFQKLVLCFFFMAWLHNFEMYNNRFIDALASTSFGVFFIHPFVLNFLSRLNLDLLELDSWLGLSIFVAVLTLSCVLVAKLIKKTLPIHSRYFVGY
jgi:surface polysaccharide O-acyltransferase-like enzyme